MLKRLFISLATLAFAGSAFAGATITVVNLNAAGVGFNDATAAAPVGGNTGATVGAQRLKAFEFAANKWGATLDSTVAVRIAATFETLTCTATSAVLGSAGAIQVISDFPGADFPATWYNIALANKLSFQDLIPPVTNSIAGDDIRARFNANLGQPTCLAGTSWYYGLDTNHAANQINLVTVLLHEFAHGLGFQSFANGSTGTFLAGQIDVYSKFYRDNTTGKSREQMTDLERKASAINPRNVVWTGSAVTSAVPSVLTLGTPLLKVNAPASAAGDYQVGSAAFGPALVAPGTTGEVVIATDAVAPTTDGCSVITNAAAVAGKIALVDRGTCGFVVKVKNAQNAGAIAVIVADNAAGGPPAGLGGADPTINIPSVRITLADGQKIKVALGSGIVNVTLGVDPAVRAGADRTGLAMLFTPSPFQSGSSISHWDTIATPNQLMEPSINNDLKLEVTAPTDLTRSLLRDIGWYPDADLDGVADDAGDQCLGSDLRATVIVGSNDSGVPNTFFTNGCTIKDLVAQCKVGAKNHGAYVSCASSVTNSLVSAGFLTGAQKGAIQSAVAQDK